MSGATTSRRSGLRYLIGTVFLTIAAIALSLWTTTSASASPAAVDTTATATATAAYPPPGLCTLTLGSATLSPNQSVTVSGSDFAPNTPVTLTLDSSSTVLGTFPTDAQGNLSATVKMPANLAA